MGEYGSKKRRLWVPMGVGAIVVPKKAEIGVGEG